mgnify:CR=1 FL=1
MSVAIVVHDHETATTEIYTRKIVGSVRWVYETGTALLLVVIVMVTRLATLATGTRWAGWLFFTGWLAATVLLAADSPSGDLAISSGARQVVYLFGGIVLGATAATLPVDFSVRKGTNRLPRPSVPLE